MKPSVGWALVGVQWGILAALVVLPAGFLWPQGSIVASVAAVFVATGILIVVLAGLRLRTQLCPSAVPKDGGLFATEGICRYIRHPVYTGMLVASAGIVLWGASPGHVVGWLALLGVSTLKSHREEATLLEKHPEYAQHHEVSGRFFPPWRTMFSRSGVSNKS
ncbi:MAG: protein-S-isoprenylcysteine O-methyltransferase Ste14 [Pontimonas sp.]|jgi:protein-S-isoprenylcysteine O-methyltransferase Ste14